MRATISRACVVLIIFFAFTPLVHPENGVYVPEQLKPWVKWVTERYPQTKCPITQAGFICNWTGEVEIDVTNTGARFRQVVNLENPARVGLPRSKDAWPLNVTVKDGGKSVPGIVLTENGAPAIALESGSYEITGDLRWASVPHVIYIAPSSAILKIRVNGNTMERPMMKGNGELWIDQEEEDQQKESDAIRFEVFRKLSDNVPFKVTTQLQLHVSGRVRPFNAGNILPRGGTPVMINSPLGYEVQADASFVFQLRPGVHTITIDSLYATPPNEISPPDSSVEGWPEHEVWVWSADEQFRTVEIKGGTPIDPSRGNVPSSFFGLPAYIINKGQALTLTEQRRGNDPNPNQLSIARDLRLALDGKSYYVRDRITGNMDHLWRLDADNETKLGKAEINGIPQLITTGTDGSRGFEIRDANVNVTAESEIERRPEIKSIGWKFDVQNLSASLRLPPGWMLLNVSGVDSVNGSWVSSWNLLSIFLTILVAGIMGRLLGMKFGAISAVALVLGHGQSGIPAVFWLHLLAPLALLKVLTNANIALLQFVRFYFNVNLALLVFVLAAVGYNEMNMAFFPQITGNINSAWIVIGSIFNVAENTPISWFLFLVLVWGFIKAFTFGRLKRIGIALLCLVGLFVVLLQLGETDFPSFKATEPAFNETERMLAPAPAPMQRKSMRRSIGDAAGAMMEDTVGMAGGPSREDLLKVDPKALVQTGNGFPDWDWKNAYITWNGPVTSDQNIQLDLLSPFETLLVAFVRLGCLLALLFGFLLKWRTAVRCSALLLIFMVCPSYVEAQEYPPDSVLQDLQQRIMRDKCSNNCAAINKVGLKIEGDAASLDASISSKGTSAIFLPGPMDQIQFESVMLDGSETRLLRRDDSGMIQVRVPEGTHTIHATGRLPNRDTVNLIFQDKPQYIEVAANEWFVEGLTNNTLNDSTIQLMRSKSKDAVTKDENRGEVSPWFVVKRTLRLGIPWETRTIVSRMGDHTNPAVVRISTLTGESINSSDVKVEGKMAVISFPRGTSSVSWEGTLNEAPTVNLTSEQYDRVTEQWVLECSPIWHCITSGIKPVTYTGQTQFQQSWKPFPGESVTIEVRKPLGADGPTMTVQSATHNVSVGERLLHETVSLTILSSQSSHLNIELPEKSDLQQVQINGKRQFVEKNGSRILLPITPGATSAIIDFQIPLSLPAIWSIPLVKMEAPTANVRVSASIPDSAWLVFAGGAPWGPVVLLWSKLVFLLLFAFLMHRLGMRPPGFSELTLLGLGLLTLPVFYMAIPVVWFALMRFRAQTQIASRFLFNLLQIVLVGLTLAMFGVLFASIENGLIMSPNMAVTGNGSTDSLLQWYSDKFDTMRPWIISLPLWCWRAVMLVWSLWLASALVRWLRWGFACFSQNGLWMGESRLEAVEKKAL